MVQDAYGHRREAEAELVAGELLPSLSEELSGEYDVLDLSDEVQEQLHGHPNDYALPLFDRRYLMADAGIDPHGDPVRNSVYPDYFLVESGADVDAVVDGEYAVAVEPDGKVIELRDVDDEMVDAVVDMAETWEVETHVPEPASEVQLLHSDNLPEIDGAAPVLYEDRQPEEGRRSPRDASEE